MPRPLDRAQSTKPVYVPPALDDDDTPLDVIEQAKVRALVAIIVREIRDEQRSSTTPDHEAAAAVTKAATR